ncbi:hypothetical protein BGW80DRAFT_483046 [Lactifluus volemus]|nr:hypothetical protein BGW80DRAFT_483046 [Lactifluus volemus]
MSRVVTTGAQGGQTPNRREINDLISDDKQFSLYIQALTLIQSKKQSDTFSHFSISGIHGQPFVRWEGAGGTTAVPGSEFGGYCTHGSVLFPTWHRPYVALYEQVMQTHALNIAKHYQVDTDSWRTAAENLRAPYWDWATPDNIIPPPEIISLQTVSITTFDGSTIPVMNPLYQYKFHPIEETFYPPFKLWQNTLRHPNPPGSPDATTDVQDLRDHLSSIQSDVTGGTWRLLTQVTDWNEFSNHTPNDGGSAINSLEAIHDNIHTHTGWGGHMGNTYVAGFDPIFFLHHANVDRILSLWAAINPGVWVTSAPAEGGTWTISGNDTIDSNTGTSGKTSLAKSI